MSAGGARDSATCSPVPGPSRDPATHHASPPLSPAASPPLSPAGNVATSLSPHIPLVNITPSPTVRYDWKDGKNFVPKKYVFDSSSSGISDTSGLTEDSTYLDYFQLYFDDDLMSYLVKHENLQAKYVKEKVGITPKSRVQDWTDTTKEEMYTYFALVMLMPQVLVKDMEDYWRKDALIHLPTFSKFMSRNRFSLLSKMLHFYDSSKDLDRNDSLRKIRPMVDFFRNKFRTVYTPFQNLVIDESLILFRGRLGFKQYIKTKRHRFGIKLFVNCDCESGMVLDFIVYTGATTDIPEVGKDPLGKSGAIVLQLMDNYLDKGHVLYTDRWYTSPTLCLRLDSRNTGSCGTVVSTMKFMPKFNKK